MVDDANITLTSLRIICNYIRDAFRKRSILPEAVHNLGTGYIEAEYGTYKYEKGMENDNIKFCYRKADCLLNSRVLSLTNDCTCHFLQHHPQLSPPLLVHFL